MNIIKRRYLYFAISLLVIIPGLIFMGIHWVQNPAEGPLPLGIDFTDGSEVQYSYFAAEAFFHLGHDLALGGIIHGFRAHRNRICAKRLYNRVLDLKFGRGEIVV